jgi:hypothetical protein
MIPHLKKLSLKFQCLYTEYSNFRFLEKTRALAISHRRFRPIDMSQYRLLFGFFLLYTDRVFRLNCLTAQPSYEGRAAVEGGK